MTKAATKAVLLRPVERPATVAAWKRLIKTLKNRHHIAVWLDKAGIDVVGAIAKEIAAAEDGLRDAERRADVSPTFLTQANLAALERLVVKFAGPRLGTRVSDRGGHIARCQRAGLVEWDGYRYRLTKEGRVSMADRLVRRIGEATDTEDDETLAHWELTLKNLK